MSSPEAAADAPSVELASVELASVILGRSVSSDVEFYSARETLSSIQQQSGDDITTAAELEGTHTTASWQTINVASSPAPAVTPQAPTKSPAEQVKVQVKNDAPPKLSLFKRLFPCCCLSKHEVEALDDFDKLAVTVQQPQKKARRMSGEQKKRRRMSVDEFGMFLDRNAQLWAMIGVNLGLEDEKCKAIAARVAMQMYGRENSFSERSQPAGGGGAAAASSTAASSPQQTGPNGRAVMLDRDDFVQFHKQIVKDPKGQQRFFHMCVFAAFDLDGNGFLDPSELDKFLDVFYQAGSIFKGDARLPPKEELRGLIYSKLDKDGDKLLTFDELQSVISGSAAQVLKE